jgi:uncharacterized protein YndB with AHSA1/START domain
MYALLRRMVVPSIQRELLLNAPQDRVWAFLTTPRFYPIWMEDVVSVQAISTAVIGPGTTFVLARRRRHAQESWIVADWEPPRRLRLAEYRLGTSLIFVLEPQAEGTRLWLEHSVPPSRGLLGRLMPPVRLQRTVEHMLARLAELFTFNQDIKLLYGMGDE